MQLAIIKKETNKVENVIVPPKGADAYFVTEEYRAYPCGDEVGIGWSFNPDTSTFSEPPKPQEDPAPAQE